MFVNTVSMSEFQVPDSVSMKDLQEAMEAAAPEEEQEFVKATTPDEIMEDAQACVKAAAKLSDVPAVFHKAIVVNIIHNYIEWHNEVAQMEMDKGNTKSAKGWLRDAGKFQAIMNILTSIEIDNEDDFMVVR